MTINGIKAIFYSNILICLFVIMITDKYLLSWKQCKSSKSSGSGEALSGQPEFWFRMVDKAMGWVCIAKMCSLIEKCSFSDKDVLYKKNAKDKFDVIFSVLISKRTSVARMTEKNIAFANVNKRSKTLIKPLIQ